MPKRRLLLADDSVTIQKVVNLTFAEEGIEVITAGDGNSAMEKFVQSPPDLVMVDVNMPGFDGYKLCEMIKQDEETRRIPVILLVGSFEPFDEDEARRVGADDYLTKPFQSIRQLVSRVSNLLNRTNGDIQSEQARYDGKNQPPSNEFDDVSAQMTNDANSRFFDETGMDDEMIQTDQIGSLPADESQKFTTEADYQKSENNFASQDTEEKDDFLLETQSSANNYSEQPIADSNNEEILGLDEKTFDFAGESNFDISERETPESSEEEKFPEYSAMTGNSNNALNDTEFDMTTQSQSASFFDFDDLNLLELPPLAQQTPPETEQEVSSEEILENNAQATDPAEPESQRDLTGTAEVSPEVIEAITKKIMEKLSDKVIKEIVQEVTPQTVESVIKEMAQKKTN